MLEKDYLVRQLREIIKTCLALLGAIEEPAKQETNEEDREASLGEVLAILDDAIENTIRISPDFFRSAPVEFLSAMVSQDRRPLAILEILELLIEKSKVHRLLGQTKEAEHVTSIIRSCLGRMDKEQLAMEERNTYCRLNDRVCQ